MLPEIVGRDGPLAGRRYPLNGARTTFGRAGDNNVVISSPASSRYHAEVLRDNDGWVLWDRRSRNGTLVNGELVESRRLQSGDRITICEESFCFEAEGATQMIADLTLLHKFVPPPATASPGPVLKVTVSGGGPVGLTFALMLNRLLGRRVAVTLYDGRWIRLGSRTVWKNEDQGNVRRQQVVTIQSRQYLSLPGEVQERLFPPGAYSEMWPAGPDSIRGLGPRNIRIAQIEDKLLELANESPDRIRLVPQRFDPAQRGEPAPDEHVLAICEGGRSRTRDYFTSKFGTADSSIYSLDGHHLQDVVLGLKVKSALPDPMSVLLTVAQNRFLLNSLRGEGFLNMRLTDAEAAEVVGLDPVRREFQDCIASRPCVMARDDDGDFQCATHETLFLPALLKRSLLWRRVREGLALFGVAEEDLTAVTAFRLSMVQRPRFSALLRAATPTKPGTYGFLLGDAANSIHFWPGRGLNSGLASAVSLARSLANAWSGRRFRDADFIRHEAAMSMLQYRHKSRAWNSMVATDDQGVSRAIKDVIARGIQDASAGQLDRERDIDAFVARMRGIRERLSSRITGLPSDAALRDHLRTLQGETVRTLLVSGEWDTLTVGGEEVDIDMLYQPDPPAVPDAAEARRHPARPSVPVPRPA